MIKFGKKKRNRKVPVLLKIALVVLVICLVILGKKGYEIYQKVFGPNVQLKEDGTAYFYIPTGSTFEGVTDLLREQNFINNRSSFEWLAKKKKYQSHIYPGKYKLVDKMNNNELINLLRSGEQTPVNLVFNYLRTKERLASVISRQIEADSSEILKILNDELFLSDYNLDIQMVTAIFVPNTYEFYWNTSAEQFFIRMLSEYNIFWNEQRKANAERIGLSQVEVNILASIIDEETKKNDEKPVIAGVYMNRLRIGIPLQACPTIKFALNDWSITRVLDAQLKIKSPYNTYKYKGLPPGPITIPSIGAIDAVLNYEKHNFLYFSAKEDFSGYHNFSKTLSQHNKNAHLYQQALNKRKILN